MYKVYLFSAGSTFVGYVFLLLLIYRVPRSKEEGVGGYFDSAGGCWTTRTPAMRAGLKDRSQSAYAAPAPKPVERATGHARPETRFLTMNRDGERGGGTVFVSRTAKEDDGRDDADAKADTTARGKQESYYTES